MNRVYKRLIAIVIFALFFAVAPTVTGIMLDDAEAGHRSLYCGTATRDYRPFAIHYFIGSYVWQGSRFHVYRSVYPLSPWQNHVGTRRC